jgi:saccharopine dehydrogenase (NAD+, L-lysine-forming)
MKKVLILGAGAQGGPCASILARDNDVSEIVLGDIDVELAKKVSEKIRSDKVTVSKLDAASKDDVKRAAKGADVVINLTLTAYNVNIMEVASESGAHYVDTSFGEPIVLDILSTDNILAQVMQNRPISFDKEFKNAGLSALLGCGGTPGTANVMARLICDKLDRVEEIRIRRGVKSLRKPTEVVNPWTPTWSPFRALWGCAVEPVVFENGRYTQYPIFSSPEEYHFPDPVGPVLVTYHQHQEQVTLPRFIGKGIKYCDFKYPVDALAGAFVKMGFASPDPVDVKGTKIVPRDVLLKLVKPPANTFFAENETAAGQPLDRPELLVVEVKGTQSGKNVTYAVDTPSNFYRTAKERLDVYKRFGTTIIGVALPAVVGAKMCVKGIVDTGVTFPECFDPVTFLKMTADMGAPVNLREVSSKELSFTRT